LRKRSVKKANGSIYSARRTMGLSSLVQRGLKQLSNTRTKRRLLKQRKGKLRLKIRLGKL